MKKLNKAPQPSLEIKNKEKAKQGTPAKFRKKQEEKEHEKYVSKEKNIIRKQTEQSSSNKKYNQRKN